MSTDLALLAADQADIEASGDPGAFVMLACERAKAWLTQALEQGDITQIIELKSQAEAIRVYTAQKHIGKDTELAAAEVVRRAERGLGLAIRKGQRAGQITSRSNSGPAHVAGIRGSVSPPYVPDDGDRPVSPEKYLPAGTTTVETYALADISDEQFEAAVDEAKQEENLSRANVIRKVRAEAGPLMAFERRQRIAALAAEGHSSRQIAAAVFCTPEYVREVARKHGIAIPADAIVGKTHRLNSNRIVGETIHALEGLRMGLDLVDYTKLDQTQIPDWSSSLKESLRSLNRLSKELNQ